ncbi:MCE family protein [Rhodococcus erythropolis]|uniref:MCE family protein n=1 Tax=Rhodococcus erythropolis TaxID=1833 RepID=UPI001C9B18D7|nr:MCE family protein [Rhodococcus erythropolis]MBY6388849.1 MCE family protein [Rhodococcus erythropolis]
MKTFSERNPKIIAAIGCALTLGAVVAALQYDKLPFVSTAKDYSAYFAEAGGLTMGAVVQVAGSEVGEVSSINLDGARVVVEFSVDKTIRLGDRTEARIATSNLLGGKTLDITPRGDGAPAGPIPLERTTSPYQLTDALGDLTTTISGLDTGQVSDALSTLAQTFQDTPASVKLAVDGVARFSQTLNTRDAQLRTLLANANKVTSVLAERSDQVVSLLTDSNALLIQLRGQSAALDQIAHNISALSTQLSGVIADNNHELKPALDQLNAVLTIVDNRKDKVQQSIKMLNAYAMSLGESVSSGPFFKAYVANLLPGQFLQPFIDAQWRQLGLDPQVLTPSQLVDPPVGQPGTPALPVPFPRTGQDGPPRLTVDDARPTDPPSPPLAGPSDDAPVGDAPGSSEPPQGTP